VRRHKSFDNQPYRMIVVAAQAQMPGCQHEPAPQNHFY
jgi:hypothetical protein